MIFVIVIAAGIILLDSVIGYHLYKYSLEVELGIQKFHGSNRNEIVEISRVLIHGLLVIIAIGFFWYSMRFSSLIIRWSIWWFSVILGICMSIIYITFSITADEEYVHLTWQAQLAGYIIEFSILQFCTLCFMEKQKWIKLIGFIPLLIWLYWFSCGIIQDIFI
jgi:hypothetical protein